MKQSIISIRNDCLLSFERAVPLAADKPVQEERPNILFILSDDHTSQSWGIYGVLGNMPATRISVAWLRRVAYWIIVLYELDLFSESCGDLDRSL